MASLSLDLPPALKATQFQCLRMGGYGIHAASARSVLGCVCLTANVKPQKVGNWGNLL